MAAVSQALVDFANTVRTEPAPGVEVTSTPRYHLTVVPDFPVPGPNSVSYVRCDPREADDVIREARALVSPRHLPLMWVLDPGTRPPDFADRLAAHDVHPAQGSLEIAVMVKAAGAVAPLAPVPGLAIVDVLDDEALYRAADAVNREAFEPDIEDEVRYAGSLEQRRRNQLAGGNRHVLLATIDGEPAGSAGLTLMPPRGAILNGGAVARKFRGRGVYRAMVAERLRIVGEAGLPGVSVWGGDMSRPILERLGFVKVGWRRFYLDTSTA